MKNFYYFNILFFIFILELNLSVAQTTAKHIIKISPQENPELLATDKFYQFFKKKSLRTDTVWFKWVYYNQKNALVTKQYNTALFFTNQLAEYYLYITSESKKAYNLCEDFHRYLKRCDDLNKIGQYFINFGQATTFVQEYEESLKIIDEGTAYLKKNNADNTPAYAGIHLKAGENRSKTNNLIRSVNYFEKASTLFMKQKDTVSFLWSQNGLSRLLGNNGLYDEAEKARAPIFLWQNKIKEKDVVVMAHVTASIEATTQDNPTKELYHIQQALLIKDKLSSESKQIIEILTRACATIVYSRHNMLKEANDNLSHLNKLMQGLRGNPFLNTYYTMALGQNAYTNKNYVKAKNSILSAFDAVKRSKVPENIIAYEELLANSLQKMGDKNQSLYHFKNYLSLKDSIQKSTARKRFAYVQSQFEVDKKNLLIKKQESSIQLLDAKNKINKQWFIFGLLAIVALFIIIYLLRSRKFARNKIRLQKKFSEYLIKNVEQERKKISSELHDSVGQSLLLIRNKMQQNTGGNVSDTCIIDKAISEVRGVSHELHPFQFEQLGLLQSLKNMMDTLQNNSMVFYSYDLDDVKLGIKKQKHIYLFRMIQECLNNVEKHVKATACKLTAQENKNNFLFSVKDNGVGFNYENELNRIGGIELKTLKERAHIIWAKVEVEAEINIGTEIKIYVDKRD